MPYDINWGSSGVAVKLYGDVSLHDIESLNDEMYRVARPDNCKYQLIDILDGDQSSISLLGAKIIAVIDTIAAISLPKMKVGIIATDEHGIALYNEYTATKKKLGSSCACQAPTGPPRHPL